MIPMRTRPNRRGPDGRDHDVCCVTGSACRGDEPGENTCTSTLSPFQELWKFLVSDAANDGLRSPAAIRATGSEALQSSGRYAWARQVGWRRSGRLARRSGIPHRTHEILKTEQQTSGARSHRPQRLTVRLPATAAAGCEQAVSRRSAAGAGGLGPRVQLPDQHGPASLTFASI